MQVPCSGTNQSPEWDDMCLVAAYVIPLGLTVDDHSKSSDLHPRLSHDVPSELSTGKSRIASECNHIAQRLTGFRVLTIATQVIGYFNFINRIADGLRVDLEDWMTVSSDECGK